MSESAQLISTRLLALDWRSLRSAALASPWSFKLLCVYVFFEYVRPQSIYSFLAGPPWPMISLVGAIAAFLAEGRRPRIPIALAAALATFTAIVAISSVLATYPDASVNEFKLYVNWLCLIILVSGTAVTEKRWYLFITLYMLFCLKMSQHGFLSWVSRGFAFTSWGVTGGPGWFQNSGEFALQMGMFVPVAVYFYVVVRKYLSRAKRWAFLFLPISAVGSIIASSSRGGMLALVVVAITAALLSKYRFRAAVVLAAGLPLLWLVLPSENKSRFSTAGSDATSVARLRFWKSGMEMAGEHPFFGVGHGNWTAYYRDHYFVEGDTLNRFDEAGKPLIQPAHNSFVEVASQLGYLGLFVFLWVIGATFYVNRQTRRLAIRNGERGRFIWALARALDYSTVAFCIAGFFMSVANYPFIWMQVGLVASLHAAALDLTRRLGAGGERAGAMLPSQPVRRFRGGAVRQRPSMVAGAPAATSQSH